MSIFLDRSSPVIVQGATGREVRMFLAESIAYGANIVAGVTPGKHGESVAGIPVFDSVAQACHEVSPQATLISVPPPAALEAALEAIDARIAVVVISTERVPRRDVAQVIEAADAAGVQVIGPNSLGLIVPDKTRVGFAGGSAELTRRWYQPGEVAVLSRSGGMMTELASMLTKAGIGQRICVSVGGDPLVGSPFARLYDQLATDPGTEAVVVFGEPGGVAEEELADRLTSCPAGPPVIAYVTGAFADSRPGVRFGHAGTIVTGERGSVRGKREALAAAGALVADRLDDLPALVEQALANAGRT